VVPSTASRTVSFTVSDGVQTSNPVTKTVTVTATSQSPVLTTTEGSSLFRLGGAATILVEPDLTVTDADSPGLSQAWITITGLRGGEEYVALTTDPSTMGNIAAAYALVNGVPTLVLTSPGASATLPQWRAALRAIVYGANDSLGPIDRVINFQISDGVSTSVLKTKTVAVRRLPVIAWSPAGLTFGTALGSAQLNATASFNGSTVAGTFDYTPAAGATPVVGTQTLAVTFTPTDAGTYAPATATASVTVNLAPTTIVATARNATYTGANQSLPLSARVTTAVGLVVGQGSVTFSVLDARGIILGSAVSSGPVASGEATAVYTLPATATACAKCKMAAMAWTEAPVATRPVPALGKSMSELVTVMTLTPVSVVNRATLAP
jgi:hypothetical protein